MGKIFNAFLSQEPLAQKSSQKSNLAGTVQITCQLPDMVQIKICDNMYLGSWWWALATI
jgi:hypothetical protein